MKMRGSETVKEDFKTQIFDIFGTVDLEQLRAIAQKVQLIESEKPHNERGAGRKNSLTPQQLAEMLALHQQGMICVRQLMWISSTKRSKLKIIRTKFHSERLAWLKTQHGKIFSGF